MSKKLLRKKLALMLATLKKKRKYYTELEYLESTGTQYIDTGVKATNKTKAIVKSVGMTWVFGGRTSVSYGDAFGVCLGQNAAYLQFGNQSITYSKTNIKNDILLLENSQDGCYVNGVKQATYNTQTFTGTHNIYLFNLNDNDRLNDGLIGKIWFSKIYEDGVLVRDFIPVLGWDGKGYMYDKVSGQLFGNAGTGDFVLGRQIHPVEYLESTGTQYIDTGIIPNINTECSMNLAFVSLDSTYRTPFSVRTADGATNSFTIMSSRSTNDKNSFAFGSSYWSGPSVPSVVLNKTVKAVLRKGYASWDGVSGNPGNSITPTTLTAYMFARNANGTVSNFFIGRIYDCQLKDNGTLVRDYIPAIDENGVGFMFDRVSHTCFLNKGTGVFKYPAREVEYIMPQTLTSVEQYTTRIDTGISPTANTEVIADIEPLNNNAGDQTIGARTGTTTSNRFFVYSLTANGRVVMGNNEILNLYLTGKRFNIKFNETNTHKVYVNDTLITSLNVSLYTKANNNHLLLFATSGYEPNYGTSNTRIYMCQIREQGVLVRDFIPAYKDGALGMWDKVNSVFYPNAGTGAFTTSKIIEPEYE